MHLKESSFVREPDIIRIAPAPFYNRFIDVYDLVEELAAALKAIA